MGEDRTGLSSDNKTELSLPVMNNTFPARELSCLFTPVNTAQWSLLENAVEDWEDRQKKSSGDCMTFHEPLKYSLYSLPIASSQQ